MYQLLRNKYFIYPLVFILWSVGLYGFAYYKGKNNEYIKSQIQNLRQDNESLQTTLQIEKDLINAANIKSEQLEESLTISRRDYINAVKQIEGQKDIINRTNHISAGFVRIIQRYENNGQLPQNATTACKLESSNKSVPADRVLSYTVNLRNWGTECMLKYNTLLNLYNTQYQIFNGN